MHEVASKQRRAVDEACRVGTIELGIQHAIKMKHPRHVVVALPAITIRRTTKTIRIAAITEVKLINCREVSVDLLLRPTLATMAQSEVHEHAEPQPIALDQANFVDVLQPRGQPLTRGWRKWFPQQLRDKRQSQADRGLFDTALIEIAGNTPKLRVARVGKGGEALLPKRPVIEPNPTGPGWYQPPELARKCFEPADRIAVEGAVL